MKLHEAKRIFAKYGIIIPHGVMVSTPEKLGSRIIKTQVLVEGRAKAIEVSLLDIVRVFRVVLG